MAKDRGTGAQFAFWLQSDDQKACEIGRLAGYDIIIFDGEHGVFDSSAFDRLIPFCRGLGLAPFVRVAEPTRPVMQSALDQGAAGVILPQIRNLAHAEAAASFAKFPPRGSRGIGFSRTMSYGGVRDDFIAEENAERVCFLMVETPGALGDAKAIAALDCVDGLFIGPGDLSLTRGRGIFKDTKADRDDLSKTADAAKASGKLFAAAAPNADYCREALRLGARFVAVADELSAMLVGFEALKKAVTAGPP